MNQPYLTATRAARLVVRATEAAAGNIEALADLFREIDIDPNVVEHIADDAKAYRRIADELRTKLLERT